jgi:peptide/nickel transport system permease protein
MVPVFLLASFALFLALNLLPGDPARRLLGNRASPEQVAVVRDRLGLDQPVMNRYVSWLAGVVQGDLGASFGSATPVREMVARALPVTLLLASSALVVALLLAIPTALLSVTRPGGVVDGLLTVTSVVSTSVPTFVWGLSFILVFALAARLLPSSGYVSVLDDPFGAVRSLALPVLAMALPSVGFLARVARAAMLELMQEPAMQFARAKGLSPSRLLLVHSLRPASVAVISVAGVEFAYLLGDTVVIEWVFSLPGLGKLLIDAFLQREYLVIQGVAVVFTMAVLLSSLVTDLVSALIDPRVREGLVGGAR